MRAARRLAVFTVLIFAMAPTGCRKKAAPPDELSQRATNALRRVCKKAGDRSEPAPSVRAVVEDEAERDGDRIVGIRLEILSGAVVIPDLTFGSVGVSPSAEESRKSAGEEWVALFAEPYCAARAAAQNGIRVGGFIAYPSLLGLRGEHPSGWIMDDAERNRRVLDAVATKLASRRAGEIGLIDLKVSVGVGDRPEGECRINGAVDTAACERITSLPWPAGKYMYKQAFAYKAAPP
jgi:hypothetical protein